MSRPVALTFIGAGCLAAAWVGWALGVRPPADVPPPEPDRQPLSSIRPTRTLDIVGDYSVVATAPLALRGDRDTAELAADLGSAWRATGLGGDPAALALVAELDEAEVIELLPKLLGEDPRPDAVIAAALRRWAEFSARDAMAWAEDRLEHALYVTARRGIVGAWASRAPGEALAWLREQFAASPRGSRHHLELDFCNLTHAWAQTDPRAALDAVLTQDDPGTFNIWWGFCQLVVTGDRRDEMLELILAIEDDKQRQTGIESSVGAWAYDDPAAAAAWLDANGILDDKTQWAVVQRYAKADPEANADWLLARATPETRTKAIETALYQWSQIEPAAAEAWVEQAGVTDGAASQLASGWAGRDPDRAITWAMRVEDEQRRPLVIGNVLAKIKNRDAEAFDAAAYSERTGLEAVELEALIAQAEKRRQRRW